MKAERTERLPLAWLSSKEGVESWLHGTPTVLPCLLLGRGGKCRDASLSERMRMGKGVRASSVSMGPCGLPM